MIYCNLSVKDGLKIIPLKKKLRRFFLIHFKNLQELRIVKWKREYSSLQALIFFNYFEYMKIIYVNYGFNEYAEKKWISRRSS